MPEEQNKVLTIRSPGFENVNQLALNGESVDNSVKLSSRSVNMRQRKTKATWSPTSCSFCHSFILRRIEKKKKKRAERDRKE